MSRPNDLPISQHFKLYEFEDPTTRTVRLDARLIDALELVRAVLRRPLHVSSGYRTAAHNADVGGVPRSRHLDGQAADLVNRGYSMEALEIACRAVPALLVIRERDHVHVELARAT